MESRVCSESDSEVFNGLVFKCNREGINNVDVLEMELFSRFFIVVTPIVHTFGLVLFSSMILVSVNVLLCCINCNY